MTAHANRGRAWQVLLERYHDDYRRDRRAVIHPAPPQVRVLSRVHGGQFRAAWAGEGPPDYAGTITGGRGVSFDAKDCRGGRWSLGQIERHQARDLEAHHLVGGAAFIALRMRGGCFVLPWGSLGPLYWRWRDGGASRGDASVTPSDCSTLGARMPSPGDWLPALLEAL